MAKFASQTRYILVLGLLGTLILFLLTRSLENDRTAAAFEQRANIRFAAIEHVLHDAAEDLRLLSQFLSIAGDGDPEEFHDLVRPLFETHASTRNFTYQRYVTAAERPAFEDGMRKLHPHFTITEISEDSLVPAKERDLYRVISYIEPLEGNEKFLGLDASTQGAQEDVILRACETGLPTITKPHRLMPQDQSQRGLVMLAPVYNHDKMSVHTSSRCEAIIGYVTAVFDAEHLIQHVLSAHEVASKEGDVTTVYADHIRNDENLIFHTEDLQSSAAFFPTIASNILYQWPAERSQSIEIANREWQVTVSASPLSSLNDHIASLFILIGGVMSSLLAAAYMQVLSVASQRDRQFSEERAQKLMQEQALRSENRRLDEERTRLQTLFDQAPGFVAILSGPQHVFDIANKSYYQLIGLKDVIGKSVREALPELEGQGVYELLDHVYASGEAYIGRERQIKICPENGKTLEVRYVDFVYQPITDKDGETTGIFVQGSDITPQKKAQLELDRISNHDPLTGLPTYSHIQPRLNEMMEKAEREGKSVIAMVIDIDRFATISESFGRVAADPLLKGIAARLQAVVADSEILSQLNGDKFLLAVSTYAEDKTYSSIMQRINAAVGEMSNVDGYEFILTCSIGIATSPLDANDPETLIQCADVAMYRARERGGNNFQLYTPKQNERIKERLRIEMAMRGALEDSELELHYQPQVDLRTGEIVAVEALIRWPHTEFSWMSTSDFIRIAEDTGLIVPLGEWVLRNACTQMKSWQNAGHSNLRVAVNISARQFTGGDLTALVKDVLEQSGLAAHHLDLELTESIVMADVEQAVELMVKLSELGVQLSIDDFGTGYSSLSYLKQFPIHVLKIDRSFVRDIPGNTNDAAIADAIISMAHSLGIRVIAEGVETEAQCLFLSRNMCDLIQGYLFSKPLSAAEMETLLHEKRRLPEHLLRLQAPARTLLLVDDEPSILSALRRQLRKDGYHIITASDGQVGLDLLASNKVDVIVSDQRMPGMTGVEFLRKVKTLYPDTVRIVLSGFTELQSVTDAVNEGAIYKFLTKPWDDAQLREHVAKAFHHKEMADENRRLAIEVRTANQELASANRQMEGLLKHKQQQIHRREISLDIVREALQQVPLPVIGLDEDQIVVFANIAANDLFKSSGAILARPIWQLIPELSQPIPEHKTKEQHLSVINDMHFEIATHRMGQTTQSRGSLVVLTRSA